MNIAQKIRALLAKAASSDHQAEAEVFLAKAHELMEKHQLESSDLEHDDPIGEDLVYGRNNPEGVDWDFTLMFSVATYFGCKGIKLPQKPKGFIMGLTGRESARVTAVAMHKYLIAEVKRLAKEAQGSREFRKFKKDGFGDLRWYGDYLNKDQCARRIGNALCERLDILSYRSEQAVVPTTAAGKNALITLDAVTLFYKKQHPDAVSIGGPGTKTTGNARKLAEGIGLNLQTGSSGSVKQLA